MGMNIDTSGKKNTFPSRYGMVPGSQIAPDLMNFTVFDRNVRAVRAPG
jgi:hypothetical protein